MGFKREFSKLIGFLVVALIAVGLVFNASGVKDVLSVSYTHLGAYMQADGSSEQIKGTYLTQISEDGELAVLSGSNQYSVSDKVCLLYTSVESSL